MAYKKGDEKGYFTKMVAVMAVIALIGSIFAYSLGAANSDTEREIEVGSKNGVTTADPSGNGPFPTSNPPGVNN